MINKLKTIFPHIDEEECLRVITEKSFDIIDDTDGEKARIIENNGQFNIINSYEKEIGFLAIDDCIYDSSDGSRADCATFDDKVFCFVELKHCKNKNISKNRRTAKKQLIATIEYFKSEMDIPHDLEAFICITCSTDSEDRITMTPRASKVEVQLEFEEFYDTSLFYECSKNFRQ